MSIETISKHLTVSLIHSQVPKQATFQLLFNIKDAITLQDLYREGQESSTVTIWKHGKKEQHPAVTNKGNHLYTSK